MKKNLCALLLGFSLMASTARAQLVSLSPGFGQYNGFSYTNLQALPGTTIAQRAWSVMVQPDGKMIVACESSTASMLLRFNDDGSPDVSFGVNGKAVVFAGKMAKALLQPDGKIVMAISNTGDFTIIRYNNDGSLDTGFGNRGIAIMQAGYQTSTFGNMILQPDGKIVVVGSGDYFVAGLGYTLDDMAVARFTANGQPDNSFDGDGKRLVPVQINSDFAEAVALDFSDPTYPTGKIVLAGNSGPASGRRLATARLLPDGTLDNSYGGTGVVEDLYSNNAYLADVKVLTNGKIVAGGCAFAGGTFDLLLVQYNVDGSRDNSFSGDGITVKPSGTAITAAPVKEMSLLPDGKILVASARAGGSAGSSFALSRYNADGSLDISFDGDGVLPAIFNTGSFDEVNALAIDNNGKYIVAGESMTNYGKTSFALNRYNSNGSFDNSFSGDGKYAANFPGSTDNGMHIIRQPDGKLLVVTTMVRRGDVAPVQTIGDYVIMRYNANGSADETWGTNGVKYTGINITGINVTGEYVRLALQADGKLVMACQGNSNSVTIARFTTTGAADVTFDGDGKINFTAIAGYSVSNPAGVAIASDGKVLISCMTTFNFSDEIGLIRLNSNGSLDNTYPGAGLARVGLGNPVAMLMLPDDKILLTVTNNPQGNLKRILTTGTADASFNNGTVQIFTPVNSAPKLLSLTTDAAGNIIVAGSGNMGAGGTQGIVARVTAAGLPDGSFGTNGVVMTDIPGGTEEVFNTVQVQADGNIIAAGSIRRAYNDLDLLLVKFSSTGLRDVSLNNNTGYFSPDLRTGSFDQVNSFVQSGTILYGTGNIRTDQSADLLLIAIDVNATVLPVSFSSFTARAQNNTALLHWQTSMEEQLKHYVVERSSDGIRFYPIATVQVKTANSNGDSYYYTDLQPLKGLNYYRISSVDLDGSKGFTGIKTVNFDAAAAVKIFPNPAQEKLQLMLPTTIHLPVRILIYDNAGRIIRSEQTTQLLTTIDIKTLPAGIYYIEAANVFKTTFIKQ